MYRWIFHGQNILPGFPGVNIKHKFKKKICKPCLFLIKCWDAQFLGAVTALAIANRFAPLENDLAWKGSEMRGDN